MTKTESIPVLTYAGLLYGTVIQPYYGGGYNKASASGQSGGAHGYLQNLGENYSGYNYVNKTWKYEALVNGPGAIVVGAVADKVAGILPLKKIVNKLLRSLKIPYRWAA